MFNEKLTRLLNALGASCADIANCGGPDRTAVAHYLSGRRIPKAGGEASARLVEGIVQYTREHEKSDLLLCILADGQETDTIAEKNPEGVSISTKDISGDSNGELGESILRWLYATGDVPCDTQIDKDKKKKSDLSGSGGKFGTAREQIAKEFGRRFDAALRCAHLSNVALSRLINVDASLISRYRNGSRIPRANSEIIPMIGATVWQYVVKNSETVTIAGEIGISEDELNDTKFTNWLFEAVVRNAADISATEQLLRAFDQFGAPRLITDTEKKQKSGDLSGMNPDEDELNEKKDVYFGNKGLQKAVIRFLTRTIIEKVPEIWLYSDQDISWMTEGGFAARWAELMKRTVAAGTRIRIIHNINRNLQEMTSAITLWLPLYISGRIEPYYSARNTDPRFAHTLFVCPGHFAIEACNVRDNESVDTYHFYEEKSLVDTYSRQYETLLRGAETLVSFSDGTKKANDGSFTGSDTTNAAGDGAKTAETDRSKQYAGSAPERFPREMEGTDFQNIKIVIHEDSIEISPVSENWKIFRFSNPLMYRAFLAYEEHIKM
ncbi:MAG: hypothetical protein K6G81_10220 [Lachnospiraceae bacterium]|nr:hypothetical protein [Lachnospiraceae bacterium]